VIVADANLLVAAALETESTSLAIAILQRAPQWHAPTLWRSEAANALVGYVRRQELSLDDAQHRWEKVAQIVAGREHVPDARNVLALAAKSRCTAYDCEYIATAMYLAMPLVTLDRELLKAFPKIAVAPADFLARL
jgi:predicted nucleic acid-binding protein